MAQVTVELGTLLNNTNFKLFDFDYTFDDLTFKAKLEEYVLDFFYDYEIGFETPDMFKRKFKARWKRIMPYYNKLYNTTLLSYNPLINSKMSEALEQLSTSTSSGNSHSTSTSDSKTSDYPQQPMAGGDYLAGENTLSSSGTSDNSGTGTTNSSYTKTIEALTGTTYQDLIVKERSNVLNVQNLIIEEMKHCFILVF